MTQLEVGIIGAGSIAANHLVAYRNDPRANIRWIFDSRLEVAQQVAQQYDATGTDNITDVLQDPELDAVSICTWNDSHAEFSIAALAAGKHVLVEKPMARTVAEAQAMVAAAEESSANLELAMVRRHAPNVATLVEFVNAGDLGDLHYGKATLLRQAGNPGGWFTDRSRSGGGPLLDLGVHVLDLCWYLMGCPKPVTVSANTYATIGDRHNIWGLGRYEVSDTATDASDVEDLANALYRFENGASLFLETSYSLHIPQDQIFVGVYGNLGGAQVEPGLEITTERHNRIVTSIPNLTYPTFDFEVGFQTEIASFVSLCLGTGGPVATAPQGLELTRMLQGAYESAAAGQEITL